jgi:hypothetical protein
MSSKWSPSFGPYRRNILTNGLLIAEGRELENSSEKAKIKKKGYFVPRMENDML